MRRAVLLAGLLCLGAAQAYAQPSSQPPSQPSPQVPGEPTPQADPVPEELRKAQALYERYMRHRLPGRATRLIDTALDLAALYYELPAMWDMVKNDPQVRIVWSQLKLLYKPRVQWSAYAGGLAESTGYAGLTAGASVDIAAPLCRYLGAETNTHGYYQNGTALSYDARGTVCLPLGPFSMEFGLLRQRELRVALSSAPSLPNSRYNSDGFEFRLRGYRWLSRNWEGLIGPTDVIFRSYSVPGDSTVAESSNFQIDSAFFRYIRYRRGFLGSDREIEAFDIDVVGQEDTRLAQMSSTVVTVSPLKFKGARLSDEIYLNAHLAFSQGRIVDLNNTMEPLENFFYFAAGSELNYGNADYQSSLRYRRRLVPDSEFRLLAEDRFDAVGQLVRYDYTGSLSAYGALTRQEAAPPGLERLASSFSYGLEAKYGRYLYGPFYLQLTGTGARSFYASIDGARLLSPELEFRALASVMASDGN